MLTRMVAAGRGPLVPLFASGVALLSCARAPFHPAPPRSPLEQRIRLNQLVVRGSHNSYHVAPAVLYDPSYAYTHAPLDVQLDEQGVRALELDVHWRPDRSGIEVYHLPFIDESTTCLRFVDCLATIAAWSDRHPAHLPIFVWIEVKDVLDDHPFERLDEVDGDLRDAFGNRLLTPDELQGEAPSVHAALASGGWPTLADARGRVIALLINSDDAHAASYTAGYTSLAGRAIFASATPAQLDDPWAAVSDGGDRPRALAAGLLAAVNTCSAGESDTECDAELAAALVGGAQMLKDDFPAPVASRAYSLRFADDAIALCDPVTDAVGCTPGQIEGP